MEEKDIPEELKNKIVKRTRKGPIGAIVVHRMTGLRNNAALKIVKKFTDNIGGRGELIEKLDAISDSLSKAQLQFLELLKSPSKKSVAHLMAEAGVEPTKVMGSYARGCVELGKVQAAIEAHRNLPSVIKELYKHALSDKGVCDACGGTGALHKRAGQQVEGMPCNFCKATGVRDESGLKRFALTKLLDITEQTGKKGPAVQVTTNVGVKVEGNKGSVFEQVMKATDEVLYKKESIKEVVEAEVVGEV